jgi:diguanylate cyclase (GGDEF)-like protein/putative nucleotidyltransferase with HDIG domain
MPDMMLVTRHFNGVVDTVTPEVDRTTGSATRTAHPEGATGTLPAVWTGDDREPADGDVPIPGLVTPPTAAAEYLLIRQVASCARTEPDPLAMARSAAHAVADHLDAAAVTIWRIDADDAHVVGSWPTRPPDADGRQDAGVDAALPVAATGRTCWTTVYPSPTGKTGPDAPAVAVRATVAAPLITPHGTWGAIAATWHRPVPDPVGDGERIDSVAVLIGALIANAVDLERLTRDSRDPLTGLPTGAVFQDRLAQEVVRSQRHGHHLALVLVAVDGGSAFDALPGRGGIDPVVATVARRLRRASRGGDVLARLDGDVFGWLLPYCTPEGTRVATERLRAEIVRTGIQADGISVPIGVCDLGQVRDAEGLMGGATDALERAYAGGDDATCEFDGGESGAGLVNGGAAAPDHARTIGTVYAMSRAVDARDPSMFEHSRRVADLAGHLARQLGWSTSREVRLREAALLHDVGKVGVPDEILLKTTALTPEEYRVARTHAEVGAQIIAGVLDDEQVLWVRHHQERMDGRGYPDGLYGDQIPDGARILTVADTWDVMTSGRPYRAALTPGDALSECAALAGTQFCPDVVLALIELWNAGAFVAGLGHLGAFE